MTIRVLCLVSILLALTGCEATKENLGLTRHAPDEFAVTTRAPLAMPPADAPVLPPPRPGAPRPQEISPLTTAQTVTFGQEVATTATASPAESDLLQKAGASNASPDIRALVDREASTRLKDNRPVYKRLLSITDKKGTEPATVLDASGEMKRIQANQAAGKAVTTGETPSVDE